MMRESLRVYVVAGGRSEKSRTGKDENEGRHQALGRSGGLRMIKTKRGNERKYMTRVHLAVMGGGQDWE